MDNLDALRQFLQTVQAAYEASRTSEEFAGKFREVVDQPEVAASGAILQAPQACPSECGQFEIRRPFPEEILHGWIGRIMVLNGLKRDRVEVLLRVKALQVAPALGNDADLVDCISTILGMPREELLRRHTLTPFFNALEGLKKSWKPCNKSSKHRAAYLRQRPFRTDGGPARLCRHCVEEDLAAARNVSYWRRGHQLPGVYICDKHATPLLVAGGADAFNQCPHHYLGSMLPEEAISADENALAILQRYAQLAAELLGSAPIIDSLAASATFGSRAKVAGLRISNVGQRKTLSTHLIEILPMAWLQRTFSRVRWEMGKYISTIDGACTPRGTRYTSATFCLLAALLYDDADQAIIELVSASPPMRDSLGAEFWGSQEVLDVYCAKNGIASHVADALGLPPSSVCSGLLNQGLPALGNSTSLLAAASAFYAGWSLDEACYKNNADRDAIEALVRASGARFAAALARMQARN